MEPRCGTLPAGGVAQIAFHFLPGSVGQHCQNALLTYDNGEGKLSLSRHFYDNAEGLLSSAHLR